MLKYLSAFVDKNQRDWDEWIPLFLLWYRSAVHETTGLSPATMLTGWNLRLPPDLEKGLPPFSADSPVNYVVSLRERLDEAHDFARGRIEIHSNRLKARYDIRARFIKGLKMKVNVIICFLCSVDPTTRLRGTRWRSTTCSGGVTVPPPAITAATE